ncbi:MAG: hypothetical protein JO101_04340 [Candidatus Eremiobacteraeota bacterium]|nr:hypothetical protein [Candidatus Eremiobacteraeota bacterium]
MALGIVLGWRIYWPGESNRYAQTQVVKQSRSEIRMVFGVAHDRGPIARETFTITNIDGRAQVAYEGLNRAGTTIARFKAPLPGFDVATLFGQAVQDGIWELQTKPPRGDTTTTYTISIYQLTNNQSGSHRFTFTDPHYWATTGGRQYLIKLDKSKPVPDLVKLNSKSLAEPRYQKLVDDFEKFGTPGYRATLMTARAKLRSA